MKTPQTLHTLPQTDHILLHVLSHIVPLEDRSDWLRTWHAELWHLRHNPRRQHVSLTFGLTRDALWLRTESWHRAYTGTVTLCLATLSTLCVISTVIMIILSGSWHEASLYLGVRLPHFIAGSPLLVLVVYVAFTTSNTRHTEQGSINKFRFWLKRQAFLSAKTTLLLLLSFLLSADLLRTPHASFPITSDLLQILAFVLLALLGLRWSFLDQQTRCKQCLRSLTTPARVGRPSHNLLEWNGTELLCRDGHGALSIPEHQTSWCQSSQWIYQSPTCDNPMSA
jgi:hypothetical protein